MLVQHASTQLWASAQFRGTSDRQGILLLAYGILNCSFTPLVSAPSQQRLFAEPPDSVSEENFPKRRRRSSSGSRVEALGSLEGSPIGMYGRTYVPCRHCDVGAKMFKLLLQQTSPKVDGLGFARASDLTCHIDWHFPWHYSTLLVPTLITTVSSFRLRVP